MPNSFVQILLVLACAPAGARAACGAKWSPCDASLDEAAVEVLFAEWQVEFSQPDADYSQWRAGLRRVLAQNNKPGATWFAGLNAFSALSWAEVRARFGLDAAASQNCSATSAAAGTTALPSGAGDAPPASVDWRDTIPLHVKNQGSCGSCWTFSTTGAVEAHTFLASGVDVVLAEQQLVDCAGNFDNYGCDGGLPSHAFEYLHAFGGQMLEADYPYTAEDGTCVADAARVAATVDSQVNITFQDENQLLEAVGRFGPVSVAFQVASDFSDYAGGVYVSDVCEAGPADVNHAVLAVGYGHDDAAAMDYWLIKNSWGDDWGVEGGYFYMERGVNMCGVSDCASFPNCTAV